MFFFRGGGDGEREGKEREGKMMAVDVCHGPLLGNDISFFALSD